MEKRIFINNGRIFFKFDNDMQISHDALISFLIKKIVTVLVPFYSSQFNMICSWTNLVIYGP